MKKLVLVLLLLALGATSAWLWLSRAERRARPAAPRALAQGAPVVLITIDTLRADRLGAYGSTRGLTPSLDSLAREAICFDAAVAQVPLTLPSHATILTGLHPSRHGIRTNDGFRLPAAAPTLAEAMRAAGYATAAFIGAHPLQASSGLARGFDRYDDEFLRPREAAAAPVERRAQEVVDAALAWLAGIGSARPPFLWVHLFDPHTPYDPPPAEAAAHPGELYDGEIAYTDAVLGRFFERLRSAGLFDRALLIVVADHGESLGEHGERTHGTFLYDATIRVPLIVAVPGRRGAGRRVAVPVESADLAPTIAELTRARLPAPVQGVSLVPLIEGGQGDAERAVYAESFYQHVLLGWSPLRAARTARWKFIEAPRAELYDLSIDPGESRNQLDAHPAVARGLAAALALEAAAARRAGAGEGSPLDSASRLQSLGYFSGRTIAPARGAIDPKDRLAVWQELEVGIDAIAGDPRAAERALRRALALDPANGLALKYLGDLAFRAGDERAAADRYALALRAGFSHADVFVNLATIAARAGRTSEARRNLERAVELDLGAADAWNQLGILRASAGDLGGARQAFTRATDAEPGRPEAYYNLALIDRREGAERDARSRLQQAIERNPSYAEAHYEMGSGYLASRDLAGALAEFRAALAARPDYPEALFSAARVEAELGESADARRHFERFLRVAPAAYREHVAIARREIERLK